MRRFDMRLPAVVRLLQEKVQEKDQGQVQENAHQDGGENRQENELHTETQNVSARGVFFTWTAPCLRELRVKSLSPSRPTLR